MIAHREQDYRRICNGGFRYRVERPHGGGEEWGVYK